MGFHNEFVANGNQVRAANVYDQGKQIVHLSFKHVNSRYPFINILSQTETEKFLVQRLAQFNGTVRRNTRLRTFSQNGQGVTAYLINEEGQEEIWQVQYLVGCDGAHSTVRSLLNMKLEGEDYEEGFQLADVKVEWPLSNNELHVMIHEGYLLAIFPMPDGRFRITMDVPVEQAPRDKTPTLEEIQVLIDQRSHVKIKLSDPGWMANYRIHRRIAPKLRDHCVFIAGDAAHIHSPTAAQGMNTGIQDAFNLGWKLDLVLRELATDALLDSFHEERHPVQMDVLKETDLILKMVSIHNPISRAARNFLAPYISQFNWVQKGLSNYIAELEFHYKESSIVEDHALPGPKAGERAIDAPIQTASGASSCLYQLLQAGHFLLMLFLTKKSTLQETQALLKIAQQAKTVSWPLASYLVMEDELTLPLPNLFETVPLQSVQLFKDFEIEGACAYLIRPDGYIGFRADAMKALEYFPNYWHRHFQR